MIIFLVVRISNSSLKIVFCSDDIPPVVPFSPGGPGGPGGAAGRGRPRLRRRGQPAAGPRGRHARPRGGLPVGRRGA